MDALCSRFMMCFLLMILFYPSVNSMKFSRNRMRYYRDKVKSMFYHAYDSYLRYAYPLDELKPISCQGMDTWGSFSLTLIDSLDTLLIMGNESEFIRAANVIIDTVKVDANVNVSVFETNIRVVGGLLAAHFLSGRVAGMKQEAGWPCSGPLLRLAERFAQKLLPAFNTDTGMPYGTVNLRYGVHRYETPITCTAGVGTMILEFGTLSRITGNPMYERVALKALDVLWKSRSSLGLVGNHINVQTGAWTATDAGIGAGVDSYFEYLAKGALLFQRPRLMYQFNKYVEAINAYVRKEDWFVWVSMTKGQVSLPIFQSLEAFWPGLLALTGNIDDAQRIIFQYSQITRQYGFPPEFYNIPSQEAVSKRSGYPLRPEFVESLYYIYRATGDPIILHLAANIIELCAPNFHISAIEHSCRTTCGYATIKNVNDHTIEDRMESFFLSETTKYLYLLFDPENFMNNDGTSSRIVETPNGPCVLDAGGYIFNTEAHPLDPAAIYCCSAKRNSDIEKVAKFEDSIDLTDLIDITDPPLKTFQKSLLYESVPLETLELEKNREEHSLRNVRSDVEGEVEETEGYDSNSSHVVSEEETNEQGNLWRTVTAADASFEHSGRSNREGDEKTKKETASEKIKKLLDKARKFDKEISEKSRRKSNFAAELSVALKTLQEKLTAVVDASNHLSSVNMAVRSGGLVDEVSIPVATCKDCCRPLDATFDSLLLKKMMSLIYGRYIYPHRGIQTTNGPICAHNEQPLLEDEYINQWPDVSGVDTRQRLDAVDDIRLSSFRYHSLAEEHYELLSGPPLSYLSQFTGLGQVTPRIFNETHLRG